MDTETATTVLTILGMSFGVIFASLITLMAASIRIQHRDSTETRRLITDASKENRDLIDQARKENRDLIDTNRDLIDQARKENRDLIDTNRDLIDQARKENRDLIDTNRDRIERNRDLIEKNHGVVISILGDIRERLARIEGHLRIGWPATDDPESDGDSREAA